VSRDAAPAPRGAWPHIRAALVLAHVLAIGLCALPAPEGGMQRASWQDPTVQDELAAWDARLVHLGLHLDPAELEDRLWVLARGYTHVRNRVLAPLQPYYRILGTNQSWRMFVAPHRYPARLHISVEEGGSWREVYVARDPQLDWLGPQLDHDRFRSALFRYAWPSYGKAWSELCEWISRQAARDFPQARRVRLRFWKARTPSPQKARQGIEPPGRWVRARTLDLEPLRPAAAP